MRIRLGVREKKYLDVGKHSLNKQQVSVGAKLTYLPARKKEEFIHVAMLHNEQALRTLRRIGLWHSEAVRDNLGQDAEALLWRYVPPDCADKELLRRLRLLDEYLAISKPVRVRLVRVGEN